MAGRKVGIVGSGYVGVSTGKFMSELGHDVLYYDISRERLEQLSKEGQKTASSLSELVKGSEFILICVPTPVTRGKMDLSILKSSAEGIGSYLKKGQTIVIKSTVMPTMTEEAVLPLLRKKSGLKIGEFGLATNPEFITQRKMTQPEETERTFQNIGRTIVGCNDEFSRKMMAELYRNYGGNIINTSIKVSEMVKCAANCALASRISYFNEIKKICDKLGIDAGEVASICAMDDRIGKYGSREPGKAFAGACLPKDLEAFVGFAYEKGCDAVLLKAIKDVNDWMRENHGTRE